MEWHTTTAIALSEGRARAYRMTVPELLPMTGCGVVYHEEVGLSDMRIDGAHNLSMTVFGSPEEMEAGEDCFCHKMSLS